MCIRETRKYIRKLPVVSRGLDIRGLNVWMKSNFPIVAKYLNFSSLVFLFYVNKKTLLVKNIILQSDQLKVSFVPNGLLSCFHSLAKTSSALVDHLSCLKCWWPNKIPLDTKYLIPSTEKWSPQLSARFLTSSFCCFGTVRPNLKFENYNSIKEQ